MPKPLKRQEIMHQKVVCSKCLPELSIKTNSVDPEQTAPIGAV